MELNALFVDFKKKYPKIDYFTQEEIFQYMRMAYCIGEDNKEQKFKPEYRAVIRSDGKTYKSLILAGKMNGVSESAIRSAIKNNHKSAGYNWKYKKTKHF